MGKKQTYLNNIRYFNLYYYNLRILYMFNEAYLGYYLICFSFTDLQFI